MGEPIDQELDRGLKRARELQRVRDAHEGVPGSQQEQQLIEQWNREDQSREAREKLQRWRADGLTEEGRLKKRLRELERLAELKGKERKKEEQNLRHQWWSEDQDRKQREGFRHWRADNLTEEERLKRLRELVSVTRLEGEERRQKEQGLIEQWEFEDYERYQQEDEERQRSRAEQEQKEEWLRRRGRIIHACDTAQDAISLLFFGHSCHRCRTQRNQRQAILVLVTVIAFVLGVLARKWW